MAHSGARVRSLLWVVIVTACSGDAMNATTTGPTAQMPQPPAAGAATAGGGGLLQPSAAGRTASGAAGTGLAGAGSNLSGASAAGIGGMAGRTSAAGNTNTGGTGGSAAPSGGAGGAPGAMTAGTGSTAPVTCPATALPPGETTTTLMVGGVARTFILHVPTGYTGKTPVPFVTDWHPLQGTGSGQKGISGYQALSDSEGFIVAWPNGIDNAWNIGPCCTRSRDVDDLGFAKAIVEDVEARACIDPKRVYADGYSMGGGMSHYLACNAADVFAAVAPSAFDLLTDDEEPCHPARPISVISFRGTADPLVAYTGGASSPPNGLNVTIHFLGAEATLKKWSELDGCTGTPMDTGNGCQTYAQCKEGSEVTLCTKQGGSHDPGDAKLGWAFLKKHPMP
jgi:polyhydroxybutyrate depolymerase